MVEETKKKVLITGINGMLGQDLVSIFGPDYLVYGLDLNQPGPAAKDFFPADITDIDQLRAVFEQVKPWLVLHTAAFTNVDLSETEKEKAEAVNALGTKNVAMMCREFNAKLVHISTDYVFDGRKKVPYLESDPPCPINFYGQTKLEAEKAVAEICREYLIVRTSWLFGVHGKNFVRTIKNIAEKEGKLKVVDDQRGSPTYTYSLARGLCTLIDKVFGRPQSFGDYGVYHISNSGQCSWYEFAKLIVELYGIKALVEPADTESMKRPAKRPAFSILDKTRFETITQTRLCSWQDALKQYIKQEEKLGNPV